MFRSILLCVCGGLLLGAHANALPDSSPTQAQPADRVTLTLETAREQALTRVAELEDPVGRADVWGGLGMLYHAQNRLREAAENYRRALDEAETIHWHYLLAVVLADQGDVDGAVANFRRALELADGRHMLASYRLGLALLADGQYAAAAASLRNALAEAPEAAAVLTALGDAQLGAGNLDAARKLLEEAAGLAPTAGRIAPTSWPSPTVNWATSKAPRPGSSDATTSRPGSTTPCCSKSWP